MSVLDNVSLNLVESVKDAEECKRWLGERRPGNYVAVDTETTGLSTFDDGANIRLVQIGDADAGWAIPWDTWKGLALELLNEWEGDFVYHNLNFDRTWLEKFSDYRVPVDRTFDTMIASRIIDPTRPAGLKPLSNSIVGREASLGQGQLEIDMNLNGWNWATVPVTLPSYWYYSSLDVVLTSRIWDEFRKTVGKGQKLEKAFDLEMAVLDVSYGYWKKGMRVDLEYCEQKHEEMLNYADRLKAWGKEAYDGLLITSPAQLGRFFTDLGVEIENKTKTGKPQIDKDFLEKAMHPDSENSAEIKTLAKAILDARKARKLSTSYFQNMIKLSDDEGILRPSVNTLAARTGRQSIRQPALQTLPRTDKVVRNAFLPRNEGELLVSVDFRQIEGRALANFSGDKKLQQAFIDADNDPNAPDFFTKMGMDIFRNPNFKKDDPERTLVKGVFYGMLYGAGLATMSLSAGVPEARMEKVVNGMRSAYPGIDQFMERTEREVQHRIDSGGGFVELMDGRKLPVDPDRGYSGVNYRIQGSAAIIMKQAQVRVNQSIFGTMALLPIHDEILFSISEDDIPEALVQLPLIMNQSVSDGVDYLCDAEGGYARWGLK